MPNSLVKSFSKKSGKPVDEVERLWKKAVEITKKKGLADKSDQFFAFATGVLKKMLRVESKELLTTDAKEIVEGYMDGTPHRIRQTPINSTSKIFKRDSFLKDRKEKDKKKKSKSKRPTINQVSNVSRIKPMDS